MTGGDPAAWRACAEAAARAIGAEVLRLNVTRLAALPDDEQREALLRVSRAVKLFRVLPVVDCAGATDAAAR